MKEIGSEFWIEDEKTKHYEIQNNGKNKFLLSGRTAIDYALNIIQSNEKISKVYFPSYCCQSMIEPFVERGVEFEFYTVSFKDGNLIYNIDCNKKCDIFFAMNYFGFSQYSMDYYIEKFKENNICVIEDATHSFLSKRKYNKKSDFVIASLRKWFPIISGGLLINQTNKNISTELRQNEKYVKLKKQAMIEKNKYILGKEKDNKKQFLELFSEADEILNEEYKECEIDEISYSILKNINIEKVIDKRRKNAKVLYKYLKKQKKIEYLKKVNFEEDTPLFVPIFLNNKKRNELKQTLIDNKIYCPNHWPIPKQIHKEEQKEIYNKELSLICDQRYETNEIGEYIKLI